MKKELFFLFFLFLPLQVFSQANIKVTLEVIDETKGGYTPGDNQVFSWIAMHSPSYVEYSNTDSWYSNFFDGYTGGKLEKTEEAWIWSYTFDAPRGGRFSWNPSIGIPGEENPIATRYWLKEKGKNLDFSVSGMGTISGETKFILADTYAALADANGTITNRYDFNTSEESDFLHAKGKWIVDGEGNKVILRGIGLGNYQLLEPYMWGINSAKEHKSDTQSAILASLAKLTDTETVETFMDEYRNNYMTEADVAFLKESGFNSIRLPMHYNLYIKEEVDDNTFIEKGFEMVDQLLEWCAKHEIYLILDMHAVPGGQSTDKAISDQYSPGLWDGNEKGTSEQYQTKLVTLWKEVARRYAGEKWIGGYDLINEIMYYPSSRDIAKEIRSLYKRLVGAIREVDKKHLLFIEGNGYANDFSGIAPPWDHNMAFSFHRYWCGNTQASIQWMLDIRNAYNIPVWMGESGENSNTWFTEAIELLEEHEIGWAWWAYKKLDNISGFVTIPRPDGWNDILSFLQSTNDNSASLNLTWERTEKILRTLAENTKLERAKINKDVIYALIDQPYNNSTRPYGENIVPGILYANEYDLGRNSYAYYETGLLGRYKMEDGSYNDGWVGRNDAVDVEACHTPEGNGYNIGWNNAGEWQNFTVQAYGTDTYKIFICYAVEGAGEVTIQVNGTSVLKNINLPGTGAWSTFQVVELGNIELQKGSNVIQVYSEKGFNYSYLSIRQAVSGIQTISQQEKTGLKTIYPNPGTDKVAFSYYLSVPEEVRFDVFSLNGKKVSDFTVTNNNSGLNEVTYDLQSLSPGAYQVVFSVSGYSNGQKLIKN